MTASHSYAIHHTLKALMKQKAKRDGADFTIYQLAKALEMPHSVLIKLMHPDASKRVNNPKIDTLAKIVGFFKQDGFDLTIDDLLVGIKSVDVGEQGSGAFIIPKSIPVYSMSAEQKNSIGTIDVKLTTDSDSVIALLSDEDIKPMFKKGSIFIIDTALKANHDMLVAVKDNENDKFLIRKFYKERQKIILKSYDINISSILLTPKSNYQIIGIVVQINTKT